MKEENENSAGPSYPIRPKRECRKPSRDDMLEYLALTVWNQSTSEDSCSDEEDWIPPAYISDSSGSEFDEGSTLENSKRHKGDSNTLENVIWESTPTSMKSYPFTKSETFLQPVESKNPLDYFLHILTDKILDEIVTHTNAYAPQILFRPNVTEHSRITAWKDVTKREILVFFALVLHMGIIRLNHTQDYWKTDSLFNIPIFPANMGRNRFLLLLRVLHFAKPRDDDETSQTGRLYKIKNIIDLFNSRMSEIYYPDRELSLESMILWRGRFIFNEFKFHKPQKKDVQLFMLTTPTGLVVKCLVHTGVVANYGDIVMKLLKGMLNVGHSLYLDKYFNTYELVCCLAEKGTHCTGTIKTNKKNLPKEVISRKLKKGETFSKYSNGVMVGKWRERNKDVTYISNEYQNEMLELKRRKGGTRLRPLPLTQYNAYVGGIKKQDQMLSYYPFERNSITWPSKIFMHILQLIVNNSYQLYNKYSGQKISAYDYRLSVIKSLLMKTSLPPPILPRYIDPNDHVVKLRETTKNGKILRKHCKNCYAKGKRRDTPYVCTVCKGSPGYCLDCVKLTHSQTNNIS